MRQQLAFVATAESTEIYLSCCADKASGSLPLRWLTVFACKTVKAATAAPGLRSTAWCVLMASSANSAAAELRQKGLLQRRQVHLR